MINDRPRFTKMFERIPGFRAASPRRIAACSVPVMAILVLAAAFLWLQTADPALAQDDAKGPKITAGPAIASSPQSGGVYRAGETITVTLTFSEPVTVTGKPRLRLKIGDKKRWAGYESAVGATLNFTHTVKPSDVDIDGVSIGKNQLKLKGGTIADADGNAAKLKHRKLAAQAGHKVNGAPDEPEPTRTPEPQANNEPRFAAASTTRSVNELTPPGTPVGAPVTATDDDGDTLTYTLAGWDSLTGWDTWAFGFDKDTGQIKVKSERDYGETRTTLWVRVGVSDGKNAAREADASIDDYIKVTINVINVDEPGTVSFDPRSRFRVRGQLMANLTDPDDGNTDTRVARPQDSIRNVTWKWESSADRTAWSLITGASQSVYTPVASDLGNYLRVTASYDDGHGTGKTASAVSPEAVIASPGPPQFAVAAAVRSVDENSAAGTSVGDPITATDDDNDPLTYALTGTDAGAFSFDTATGQITVKDALNYETKHTYSVTVTVSDGKADDNTPDTAVDDTVAVTVSVVNVDEPGTLTLDTQTVQVGTKITGAVTDPDGITFSRWRWHRSQDGTSWPANTSPDYLKDSAGIIAWFSYTPTADDVGYYLRVYVRYTDRQGGFRGRSAYRDLQLKIGPVTAP